MHDQNLKSYIDHGLVITKIHRILESQQRAWLKTYIDFNTQKHASAANDFEKDLSDEQCRLWKDITKSP